MNPIQSAEREKAINGRIYLFEEGLSLWGLAPEDIEVVIHTHLHNDHCENDYKCGNARFFVHEKELETIHNPHPLDYRHMEDYICEIEENGQIRTVHQDMEILPCISVLHTPAHTPGGLTVLVQTSTVIAAITGFCVIMENFEPLAAVKAMEMEVIPPKSVAVKSCHPKLTGIKSHGTRTSYSSPIFAKACASIFRKMDFFAQ